MSLLCVSALWMAALLLPGAQAPQAPAANPQIQPQGTANDRLSGTTAMVPQQLRKAEPPLPTASAAELEQKGDELRVQNAYADALDYYRAAMAKGDTAVLHDKAGIADLELFRAGDAKREFHRAIKLDKNYPEPYNNLGVLEYQIAMSHKNPGKLGRAIDYYKKALKLREPSASFHSNLGTAYFARREYDHAMAEYGRALQLDPDIFERRLKGGVALHLASAEDIGRYDYVIAKMYASTGNSERCLLYLRKAMEEGYSEINNVYKDAEFATIRKDPRFAELMAAKPVAIPN